MPRVVDLLNEHGIHGYTIIDNVAGRGSKSGEISFSSMGGIYRNSYLFTVCEPEQAERAIKELRPIFEDYSGVCYLSEIWDIGV